MLRKKWHKKLQNDIVVISFSSLSKVQVIQKLSNIFSLIFSHRWIELVELYKIVYIKKF